MCGNFGLILLKHLSRAHLEHLLGKMVAITMRRCAQSVGLVTYRRHGGVRSSNSRWLALLATL